MKIGDKVIVYGLLPFTRIYKFDKIESYNIIKIDYFSSYPITLLINNNLLSFTISNIKLVN